MEDIQDMSLKEKCYALQQKVNYFLDPDKYVIAHLDGRSFSKKIKNKFKKPFDDKFINAMNEAAIALCEGVQGALFAYVQSDEISLLIYKASKDGQIFFNGRMCKLLSIIPSEASTKFTEEMTCNKLEDEIDISALSTPKETLESCIKLVKNAPLYQFDCKVWNVDNANDAMAWFLFRNIDCIRNSKQQTCQTYLPHKVLMSKNTDEQVELLKTNKGIDWNKFDDGKKYGRLIKKVTIPHYDNEGNLAYERSKWEAFPFFDMTNVEKREDFINYFNLKDDN